VAVVAVAARDFRGGWRFPRGFRGRGFHSYRTCLEALNKIQDFFVLPRSVIFYITVVFLFFIIWNFFSISFFMSLRLCRRCENPQWKPS
jgi:hypothetical protein